MRHVRFLVCQCGQGQAHSRYSVAIGQYTPQPGDIIYFKSPRNNNSTNHVGIVTSYSNGMVYTIEGNTSSATVSTKSAVFNAQYYSTKYSDLEAGYGNNSTLLYNHFINNGIKEHRQGSPIFDANYYLNNNPDLKKALRNQHAEVL